MPDAGAELDALAAEFYEVWLRYHPDLALAVGVQPADGRWLPAQDDDDLAALRGWLETLILGLDEIDYDRLDPDRQLDVELMAGGALVEYAELKGDDWRRRDPGRCLPTGEIYRLTLDPPEQLRRPLSELLSALPERLRQAQAALRPQPRTLAPLLVQAAARESDSLRCYLHALLQAPWLRQRCDGLSGLDALAEGAIKALGGFRDYLTQDLAPEAAGGLGCGVAHLHLRLKHLHFMDCDPLALDEPIARALHATEDALAALPDLRSPVDTPQSPEVRADAHPEAGRLALYRELCGSLAEELRASALATLPRAPLRVAAAPVCPIAHCYEIDYLADRGPDTATDGDWGGTLFLPAAWLPGESETLEQARERCLLWGWGGSHVLAWAAPGLARRLARRVANGVSLTAAWGLYLSGRLAEIARDRGEAGEERLRATLLGRRERLLLARLDLDLHAGRLDADRALSRLARAGFDQPAAQAQLARIALAPGDALAGAIGWCLLNQARALVSGPRWAGLGERAFNDRLLGQGPVPLTLALRRTFGERLGLDAWDALLRGTGAPESLS